MKKLFITTPIYYASGKPHIGHAYTTILADVIARYKKALGYDVFFLTGMDEHGQKIVDTAKKNNLEVQAMLDSVAKDFKQLWKDLDIDYDGFIRTTDKKHEEAVQKVFSELLSKNCVSPGVWKGLYCVNCEENYTRDQAIEKDGKLYCKVGHELTEKNEPTYLLKLSDQSDWIKEQILHTDFIFPPERSNELIGSFIKKGLQDLSITRTSFDWGVKVKEDHKHVIYVWIDALLSYLSGLGYKSNNEEKFNKYWKDESSEVIHLMSKEITRFHCIYWPILLKKLGLWRQIKIISHTWIVTSQGKMSKSFGNVVDPAEYIKIYGSDALRYFLLKQSSYWTDSIFSRELFEEVFNSDLANNVGNMTSRITSMIKKYCGGVVPSSISKNVDDKDALEVVNAFQRAEQIGEYMKMYNFSGFLSAVKFAYLKLNKYIENKKPWELAKKLDKNDLHRSLNFIFNYTYRLLSLLSPILINTSKKVEKAWGVELSLNSLKKDWVGTKIEDVPPLFPRITDKK